jgi:hypothetical protein
MRSQRPPVHEESSLLHKAKRFKQWMATPAFQKKELDFWNSKCDEAKTKFHELEVQREEWNIHFEQSRKMCIETHQELSHGIRRLKRQAKHLFRLCENECAQGNTNGSASANKAFTNKDLVDELIRREQRSEKLKQDMKVLLEKQAVKVTLTEADCVMSSDFNLPITIKQEASLDKTSSSSSIPAVKVEHSSTPMDIDEEDESNNNTVSSAADKRQIGKQLLSFLQQLNDYIARSESMEHDVEWFFLEQDDLTMIESLIQKEFGAHAEMPSSSSSTSAASASSSHANMTISEEKMAVHRVFTEKILHVNKNRKNKEDGMEHKDAAEKDKESHDHAALQRLLNKIFEAMDPVGTTTRKKKQRSGSSSIGGNNTEQIMKMQTFARHRTEIGLPLILSAASCFEDRYIGVQKCETIFSPAVVAASAATNGNEAQSPDSEKIYQVANFTPLPLQQLEDDVMTRCQLQSEAAYTAEKIKKLQVQLIDLQKSLQDANHARNRALQIYRNVEIEDMNERQRMKNNHIQYGFIPGVVDGNHASTSLGNTTSGSGGGSSSSSPVPMADATDNVASTSMGLEIPPVPTTRADTAEELPAASAMVAPVVANGKANSKSGKAKSRR